MFLDKIIFEKIKIHKIVINTSFKNEEIVKALKEKEKQDGCYSSAISLFDCEPFDLKIKKIYKEENMMLPLEIKKGLRNIRRLETE